jgi:hypothetical protein
LINLSSAGAKSRPPHQTRQQFVFFTNSSISSLLKLIFISTLTHSHVAAGDVIDFEKFFGILIPKLATSGIKAIVVSFPGTHPIQCLSAMISHFGYLNIAPHSAMALAVRYVSSSVVG